MPNNYKQGSITDKINKLKANQTNLTGKSAFDPNLNLLGTKNIGSIGNQLLNPTPTSLIPNYSSPVPTQKPVIPIVPTKQVNQVVPPITPENLNNIVSMPPISNESVPTKPVETKDDSDSNFLASLIGQGFAMMGAGIANRDPGQVGQQISQNRMSVDKFKSDEENRKQLNSERLDQIERAKNLVDPQSEESKRKRITYGNVLNVKIPETASAYDLDNNLGKYIMDNKELEARMAIQNQKLASKGQGGSGTGKIGKDQKEFNQFENNVEGFKNSLDKYKQMVKDIPFYDNPLLHTQERQNAESQKAMLTAQLKEMYKLGTLDSGVSKLISDMIGDPSFTLNKNIESKIENIKSELDSQVNQQKKMYGQQINKPNIIEKQPKQTRIVLDKKTGKRLEIDSDGNILREM